MTRVAPQEFFVDELKLQPDPPKPGTYGLIYEPRPDIVDLLCILEEKVRWTRNSL